MKNFLDINKIPQNSLKLIIKEAKIIKERRKGQPNGASDHPKWLNDRIVGLIFEKPSTRTRVSFDVGVRQMGGKPIILSASELQLGNGENISDTAKVLSLYLDMVLIRTLDESKLHDFVNYATIPVINGLTNQSHPCQIMADIMTFEELRGCIKGKKVVWVGDGNNVCTSYIHAAGKFDFNLAIAAPEGFLPNNRELTWAKKVGAQVEICKDATSAAQGADLVVTDTHLSMHDKEASVTKRLNALKSFQVDDKVMRQANSDAIFLHCLPAHRGVEVTANVIDGPQSAVFEAALNRLHVQKAIMRWCMHASF